MLIDIKLLVVQTRFYRIFGFDTKERADLIWQNLYQIVISSVTKVTEDTHLRWKVCVG